MEIKGGKTLRGFRRYWFTDSNGRLCDLQDSSNADGHCIWFGVDGVGKRMHLSQSQVAALMPYLTHFVDTGELPEQQETT